MQGRKPTVGRCAASPTAAGIAPISNLTLRRELVKDFYLDLSFYHAYDNRPPDIGLTTSLGYSFYCRAGSTGLSGCPSKCGVMICTCAVMNASRMFEFSAERTVARYSAFTSRICS